MQKDGSHDASPPGLPESPLDPHTSSSRFQPSEKMKYRLEKLAEWRIDQSSIEFPKEPCEIRGGNATVSRAVLVSPSNIGDSIEQYSNTRVEGVDLDGTDGQTSWQRKQDVAVKKMEMPGGVAQALGWTIREAEFLVGLSHQNVIKLDGFVEDLSKDIVWLVFPWEENGTLRDFIASADWEIPERIWLIANVASGVEYLHGQRPPICHGDLKSLNILVNSKCFAVITDFGSARHLKIEELSKGKPAQNKPQAALSLDATFCASTNTITLTGDHYTLRWAAPELLYDEKPSLCSDIWAFGWVAYEVMTNSIPFQNVKDTTVIIRLIRGDLPSITDDARMSLIQALCSLMIMCWSIDPSKRPTAEDCRKSINWMPMIAPSPRRTYDTADSRARSPELLMTLGTMYRHQGDYSNAVDLFTEALGGYTDHGDRERKVTALLELAQVHRFQNECDKAIGFYSEAIQICTDIGDRGGRAGALFGLAEVHRFQQEYDQAVTFYLEALQFSTDIGDRWRACSLMGLADVHLVRKEDNQAIKLYSECLQICTEARDRQGSASALRGLARVHHLRNQYSQATTRFSEALQMSGDMGDQSGRAQALLGLADVRRDQDDHREAIRLYTEAREVFKQVGDTYNAGCAERHIANVRRVLSINPVVWNVLKNL